MAVGRALPAGAGRRVGEPFDLSATLETVLSRAPFDVVHLHEPLAPSPALAALRHAPGVTAATFHRAEPLAGVAFLRPLIDRALARADLRIATTEAAREALSEILPGDYSVVAPGVDVPAFPPAAVRGEGPPGLVLIARGRDRIGVRFALGVLRGPRPRPRRPGDTARTGRCALAHAGCGAEGAARPRGGRARRRTGRAGGGARRGGHRPRRRPRGRGRPRAARGDGRGVRRARAALRGGRGERRARGGRPRAAPVHPRALPRRDHRAGGRHGAAGAVAGGRADARAQPLVGRRRRRPGGPLPRRARRRAPAAGRPAGDARGGRSPGARRS